MTFDLDNWKRRTQLVQFCSSVVDQSLAEKRASLADSTDAATQRKTQASIFEEQVKVRFMHLPRNQRVHKTVNRGTMSTTNLQLKLLYGSGQWKVSSSHVTNKLEC